MEPKHCAYALGHLNHQLLHNRVSACFRCSEKLGDYRQQTMSEIMNSEPARAHRKKLMSGEWPKGCGSCKDYEDKGQPSTRTDGLKHFNINTMLPEYNPETGEIKKLRSIELRFGNECNLTCRHCNTVHSSKWEALVRKDPTLLSSIFREQEQGGSLPRPDYFEDVLKNIIPGVQEIMFSGGETLYQKAHYKFIDAIPEEYAKNMTLSYVTNGSVKTLPGWDLTAIWKKFKWVDVLISTDGVKERYEYFRVGADWNLVEENIRMWKALGMHVTAEVTCSVYQVFYLIEILEHLYEQKYTSRIGTSLVQYPPVINPRVIAPAIKQELKAEWDEHIANMTDLKKKEVFIKAGQHIIDYMMGDELDIYDLPNGYLPTWKDFEAQARKMDELFKTSIDVSFPKIAKYF